MEVPRTSSGKPCKLCLAKGGPCHLHSSSGGPPGKKTSGTIYPKSAEQSPVQWINQLPQPALYEFLMHLDRKNLYLICSENKKAKKICNLTRFQKEYNSKHTGGLFRGDLREVENYEAVFDEIPRLFLTAIFYDYTLGDDIHVTREDLRGLKESEYGKIFRDTKNPLVWVGILGNSEGYEPTWYYSNSEIVVKVVPGHFLGKLEIYPLDKADNFLVAIGHPEWKTHVKAKMATLDPPIRGMAFSIKSPTFNFFYTSVSEALSNKGKKRSKSPKSSPKAKSSPSPLKLTPKKRREMEKKWDEEHGGRWWSAISHYPF